jgi:glycosyltransferase involved in cell wall biosynthesis
VVALSTEMSDFLLNHRPKLVESQIEVIPNWTEDISESNKDGILKNKLYRNAKSDNRFVISYFGNMGICQDLDTIIEAIRVFKEDASVKFVFAGHGSKYEFLKGILDAEKITNVSTYDFLVGEDFQAALYSSDCFVISLVEGLSGLCVPSKTYSYMMAGKPIIAIMEESYDVAKEIMQKRAGYVLRVGDVSGFVQAVKELQTNLQARQIMSEESRNLFLDNYTKNICTNQYVELLNEVLGEQHVC